MPSRNSPIVKGEAPKACGLSCEAGRPRMLQPYELRCAEVELSLDSPDNPRAATRPLLPCDRCRRATAPFSKGKSKLWHRLPEFWIIPPMNLKHLLHCLCFVGFCLAAAGGTSLALAQELGSSDTPIIPCTP